MSRITNIFQNRPDLLGQTQNHCRRATLQRTMYTRPIVQISPKPQGPLQTAAHPRAIASPPGKASLLTAQGPVEAFQMRGIDSFADVQSPNPMFYILQTSKQGISRDIQQPAFGISNLLDNSYQQRRRWLESGLALSATALLFSPPMLDKSKYLQNRRRIWQMLVYQQQGQFFPTTDSYCSEQFAGGFQSARPYPQIQNKATCYLQRRVNPRPTRSTIRSSNLFAPFFDSGVSHSLSDLATRPCNSSKWTDATLSARRSADLPLVSCNRSDCNLWKSSARLPPFCRYRSTVRWSTSQMSAVASIEQPCPRHLMMRTTTSSGSFVSSIREPSRSLKRVPQVLQYNRRMALSLPIRSAMDRLPAAKRLKSAQSGLGQAKKDKGNSGILACRDFCWFVSSLAIISLPAQKSYLPNNSSAKRSLWLQNLYYCMPIS